MSTNLQTGPDVSQQICGREPFRLHGAVRAEAVEGRRDLLTALPDLIGWAEEIGGCVEYVDHLRALRRAQVADDVGVLTAFVLTGTFPSICYWPKQRSDSDQFERVRDARPAGATNRCFNGKDSSSFVPEPPVLVDTIAVKGEISGHHLLGTRQRYHLDSATGEMTFQGTEGYLPDGVPIRIAQHNGKMWVRIEQSVPNYLHGNNIHCTPLAEALDVVAHWYEQASAIVDWITPAADLRVPRLDLPIDFDGITDFDHLLNGLGRLRVDRTNVYERIGDGSQGDVQTLRRGVTRSWIATAYDKSAEIRDRARHERSPERQAFLYEQADRYEGRLRVEPSLRARHLQPKGLVTVADCNEDLLADLRHDVFTRARLDEAVGGAPHLHDVLRHLPVTDPDKCKFWPSVVATLMAEALGLPDPVCDKTAQRNRRLARKWAISAADMAQVAGPAVVLDYNSGILRAAA